jgi:hypothetical protein
MTTPDTCRPTSGSSCSGQAERGDHFNAILALGKRIVAELSSADRLDTLGLWMSHYIAELMVDAESATGAERLAKMTTCADMIMKLWSHRRAWSGGTRPMEDFEPVFRTLESLDPTPTTPRYFRNVRLAMGDGGATRHLEEETPKQTNWLDLASKLDYTARELIRCCLSRAIEPNQAQSEEWLMLAKAAMDAGDDPDLEAAELIIRVTSFPEAETEPDDKCRALEELVAELEKFGAVAIELLAHLRSELDATGAENS